MMYIRWLIYFLLNLPVMLICYITNPVVVLFADKNGELPLWCKLWQTWDDSVYSSDVVHNKELPDFLLYDYDAHYTVRYDYSDIELKKTNNGRWYSDCYYNDFTFAERIQRYICGVYWLTRNCAYGWAFWLFGCNIIPANVEYSVKSDGLVIGKYGKYFIYKDSRKFISIGNYNIFWNNFLGWKFKESQEQIVTRSALAIRIAFKIRKAGDY